MMFGKYKPDDLQALQISDHNCQAEKQGHYPVTTQNVHYTHYVTGFYSK